MNELTDILYIEDDEDIAELTMMALVDVFEFKVKYCQSGSEALQLLQKFTPQLILTDVMMPEMDGPMLFKSIKAIPNLKDIPIVFMTARVQPHEIQEYHDMGAIDVIIKPFDPLTLGPQLISAWEKSHASKKN